MVKISFMLLYGLIVFVFIVIGKEMFERLQLRRQNHLKEIETLLKVEKTKQAKEALDSMLEIKTTSNGILEVYINTREFAGINLREIYDRVFVEKNLLREKENLFFDDTKKERYFIYEWAVFNNGFINKGTPLLVVRINNSRWKEIRAYNEVVVTPELISKCDGYVEIIKEDRTELEDGMLICKIHPTNPININNSIIEGYFNRYEIPINKRVGLSVYISKWIVNNGEWVEKGDEILEFKTGVGSNIKFKHVITSASSGFMEHLKHDVFPSYEQLIQGERLFVLYKTEKERDDQLLKLKNVDNNIEVKPILEECYVYLMFDESNGYYKIGISNTPEYREKTLQSEKPTIVLVTAKSFPSRRLALSFEKALHNTFETKRLRGEWFSLDKDEFNEVKTSLL